MHNDKFNSELINFFNNNFNKDDHLFIFCCGGRMQEIFSIPKFNNILILKGAISRRENQDFKLLLSLLNKSKKIILHGLFLREVFVFFDKNKYLLKKCSWIIWGGDLYHYKYRKINPQEDAHEEIRKRVIANIGNIITGTKGDYELAKKWYNTKASYVKCFAYSSMLSFKIGYNKISNNINNKPKNKFNILLGNSAASTNNHIEAMQKLAAHKDKIKKIICPLSYCNEGNYADNVIREGKKYFGKTFYPILEYMDKAIYEKMLLEEVDIAIFNHERQQAFGNITMLLAMGKKVYINKKSTLVDVFKEEGLDIFFSNNIDKSDFFNIDKKSSNKNMKIMKDFLSTDYLLKQWKGVFKNEL